MLLFKSFAWSHFFVLDADIKTASLAQVAPTPLVEESQQLQDTPAVETNEYPVQSDPTIAHAGLTEIDEPVTAALTNGHSEATYEAQGIPQNSGFGDGAANAAAEANWDTNNDLSTSQEWVEVPRDATETDTGITATPAAPSNVQSWADDQPDSPVEVGRCLSLTRMPSLLTPCSTEDLCTCS